jgi:PBP4 family serine-type D-alanyl-D-alanine carboxypeptidase
MSRLFASNTVCRLPGGKMKWPRYHGRTLTGAATLAVAAMLAACASSGTRAPAAAPAAVVAPAPAPAPPPAPQGPTFQSKLKEILARPEFLHSSFGIEFYDLDRDSVVFSLNAQKLFTPASTTKLLTEGTALTLMGADYRFHTPVYRTGPVVGGTLRGDLILVATGDLDLSNRIQADGTLAFENEDHAYDGSPDTKAVPGDPLQVLRELAKQVAAAGIKQVRGHVMVDASMFPEGTRELGTGVVISPIVVNDNLVDVTVGPGASEGAPVSVTASPVTPYVHFVNQATTGAEGARAFIRWAEDATAKDGSHTVTIKGHFPMGQAPILYAYAVPKPSRFAAVAFAQVLRDAGVHATVSADTATPDFSKLSASYTPANRVAEHVSPPLSEDVKVTLKVSQNLHASTMPYIVGSVVGHASADSALQTGFNLEHDFLEKAGLDLSGASQGDGAGGAESAFFTPDFMAHYLAYMSKQPDFDVFHRALPILGQDGTLWNIQTSSPAVGHVHAKTGTFGAYNALNRTLMLTGKGLAGYVTTQDGHRLSFALYLNRVPMPRGVQDAETKIAGQTLGEIAALAYQYPFDGPTLGDCGCQ